jgi:hypothetical protein
MRIISCNQRLLYGENGAPERQYNKKVMPDSKAGHHPIGITEIASAYLAGEAAFLASSSSFFFRFIWLSSVVRF